MLIYASLTTWCNDSPLKWIDQVIFCNKFSTQMQNRRSLEWVVEKVVAKLYPFYMNIMVYLILTLVINIILKLCLNIFLSLIIVVCLI